VAKNGNEIPVPCPLCRWAQEAVDTRFSGVDNRTSITFYGYLCRAPVVVAFPWETGPDEPKYGPPPFRHNFVDKDDTCFAGVPRQRKKRQQKLKAPIV
jgi:hypothetical protein